MNCNEALEKILNSFTRYYNVKTSDVEPPFSAEAEFHAHGEKYLLVKSAHIADIDSNEYVFFASEESLDAERLNEIVETAWERGISRIKPYYGHRNSDVVLFIFADGISEDAVKLAKKIRRYKSYMFSIYGWSHFRLAICDCSVQKFTFNRMGKSLSKLTAKFWEPVQT
ncbi:MAG: hypothetical protein II584_04915 [Treponema sp.]|nr:hypothetical protein [Treponema sp.]MBQ2601708.1 hypothetical protein [Treponema sp.]